MAEFLIILAIILLLLGGKRLSGFAKKAQASANSLQVVRSVAKAKKPSKSSKKRANQHKSDS